MTDLQFFLPMAPPTATGQMRKVRMLRGKPQFYEPDSVQKARLKLREALWPYRPEAPHSQGVRLLVKWIFPCPDGDGRDGQYRTTRPDTDNLQKLLKDEMTFCGFWQDDSLVCSEIIEKFWGSTPGIFLRIEVIEP